MKKSWLIIILVIVLLAIVGVYFWFFYSPICKDSSCFSQKLVDCKRASFISETPELVFQYNILGKSLGKCDVRVKLLQVKVGTSELSSLENKEMTCSNDLGVLITPEKNLKNCHGLLKETIQDITIERMHTQLFNNLENIKDVEKVI
jgi:hypothetical protein